MQAAFIMLLMGIALHGCAAVWPTTHDTLYYYEKGDGTRFYSLGGDWTIRSPETDQSWYVSEGLIWVTPDGTVYAPGDHKFTPKVTNKTAGDWDLHEYSVEKPAGYCIPLWSRTIQRRPESCWNRLWEVPTMIVVGAVMAKVGLLPALLRDDSALDNASTGRGRSTTSSNTEGYGSLPQGYLGPINEHAYGPGMLADATGRPFMWVPQGWRKGYPHLSLRVTPNDYAPGVGAAIPATKPRNPAPSEPICDFADAGDEGY